MRALFIKVMTMQNLLRRLSVTALVLLLLGGCAFPKRDPQGLPDVSVIKVELQDGRWVAVPPECLPLFTEFSRPKYDSMPQYPFGCATYTNLANQLANPRDLVQPADYAGQHVDSARDAVTRYRENRVTPLRETETTQKQ